MAGQRALLRLIVLSCVTASLLLASGIPGWSAGGRSRLLQRGDVSLPAIAARADTLERPVYRHSVVPGGVHSARELHAAVAADEVVAAHYAPLQLAGARPARTAAARRVYMSYRMGDRVYWTRRRVALPEGEPILTAGGMEVRARCGNRISDLPMMPVSPEEPETFEFDLVLAPEPLPGRPRRTPAPLAAFARRTLSGGAHSLSNALASPGPAASPGGIGDVWAALPGPAVVPLVAGGAMPISSREQPDDGLRIVLPGGGSLPVLPLDPPGEPRYPPVVVTPLIPGGPDTPPHIPEPGTLLLVATGVGVYALRRACR